MRKGLLKHSILLLPAVLLGISLSACNNSSEPSSVEEQQQPLSEKRGVAFSFEQFPIYDAALLSPAVTWFYNWGPDVTSAVEENVIGVYGFDYCPMVWNGSYSEERIRTYVANHPECQYLLGFNEPNLTDQANMTPSEAAALWPQVKALADELGLKLVSPAMNYGTLSGYSDPVVWLDEFFSLVPDNGIVAISLHCYMGSAASMKSFIERFEKYNLPIWLTEFCAWESSGMTENTQINYLSAAIPYLEKNPLVERYAWFIPRHTGYPYMALISNLELSDVGKVYVNMTTMDQTWYAAPGQRVEAEHYTNSNVEECIGTTGMATQAMMRVTTDTDGNLDLCTFTKNSWVEYQFNVPSSGNYLLCLRNLVYTDTNLKITIDGSSETVVTLAGEKAWADTNAELSLTAGRHIVRLQPEGGNIALNWLQLNKE